MGEANKLKIFPKELKNEYYGNINIGVLYFIALCSLINGSKQTQKLRSLELRN